MGSLTSGLLLLRSYYSEFIDLQILQITGERHEAELYQKNEEIQQKNTQLEQVQVNLNSRSEV